MMDTWNDGGPRLRGLHHQMTACWHGGHVLVMLIGLLIIAGLVALALRARTTGRGRLASVGQASATPEEILRVRFAKGKIDADEFRSRMEVLAEQPAP